MSALRLQSKRVETSPTPMRTCDLAWIAVRTSDQADVAAQLGLAVEREISWGGGVKLIDEIASDGERCFSTVVVTPEMNDGEAWLVAGDGEVVRRWVAEYPELELGEPGSRQRSSRSAGRSIPSVALGPDYGAAPYGGGA